MNMITSDVHLYRQTKTHNCYEPHTYRGHSSWSVQSQPMELTEKIQKMTQQHSWH